MNEKTESRLRRARKSRHRMRNAVLTALLCFAHPAYLRPGDRLRGRQGSGERIDTG